MANRPSFSLTKALSASFTFVPAAWAGAWLALAVLWALATFAPVLAAQDPVLWVSVAVTSALLLAKLMCLGSLYRVAIFGKDARKEGLGFGGLQIARPELRLLIAQIVAALFVVMIAIAMGIVFAIGLRMYGISPDAMLHPVMVGVFAVILAMLVFVSLKFSLMHAANIAERRLVTLNALGLTSGQVGKLFVGMVVLIAPFAVLCFLFMQVLAPEMRLADAMPFPWMRQRMTLVVYSALMFAAIGLLTPLLIGFFASAYRQITVLRAQ